MTIRKVSPSPPTERVIEIETLLKRAKLILPESSNLDDAGVLLNLERLKAFAALYQASAVERIASLWGADIPDLKPKEDSEFIDFFGNRFRRTGVIRQVQKGDWHCGQLESGPRCVMFDPEMEHVCEILERVEK